ncbi:MAG TPA: DUF1289 domain-containing protein [Gammaproteobacteria bacterium]|nr:DUF1289 domain-containing protein [Gammaproteobacteria bacterium]
MSGGTLPSPCVRNCCLDEQDICLGCGRSLDEIRDWSASPDPARQQILERAAERRAARVARLHALHHPGTGR